MSENIILKARKYRKLTQQQLADIMGADRTTISKMENKSANPTVAMLEKVASALNMTLKIEFIPNEETKHRKEGDTMPREYLEINLPPFLQESIDDLVKCREQNLKIREDCHYMDTQSSINIAFVENMIDETQANYLRDKYLYQKEV